MINLEILFKEEMVHISLQEFPQKYPPMINFSPSTYWKKKRKCIKITSTSLYVNIFFFWLQQGHKNHVLFSSKIVAAVKIHKGIRKL